MADVSKIQLPDNTTLNIKDYRITGVDTTPTSGSSNVVTSGGVYTAIASNNTTGATDTSNKIYLVGATEQTAHPQTYSDNEVYTTSGVLTTKSVQVGVGSATMQYNSTDQSIEFIFA